MRIAKEEVIKFESRLIEKGYRRFSGHYKKEDHGYWKSFHLYKDEHGDTEREYQIAILFYDFTKYDIKENVAIQFEFLLANEEYVDRMDFSITDDHMTVEKFEEICEKLYHDIFVNYIKVHNRKLK